MKVRLLVGPQKVVQEPRHGPYAIHLFDEIPIVEHAVPSTKVLPHCKSGKALRQRVGIEGCVKCLWRVQPDDIPTRLHPPNVTIPEDHPDQPPKVRVRGQVIFPGNPGRETPVPLGCERVRATRLPFPSSLFAREGAESGNALSRRGGLRRRSAPPAQGLIPSQPTTCGFRGFIQNMLCKQEEASGNLTGRERTPSAAAAETPLQGLRQVVWTGGRRIWPLHVQALPEGETVCHLRIPRM
jgi:hypothetical protein